MRVRKNPLLVMTFISTAFISSFAGEILTNNNVITPSNISTQSDSDKTPLFEIYATPNKPGFSEFVKSNKRVTRRPIVEDDWYYYVNYTPPFNHASFGGRVDIIYKDNTYFGWIRDIVKFGNACVTWEESTRTAVLSFTAYDTIYDYATRKPKISGGGTLQSYTVRFPVDNIDSNGHGKGIIYEGNDILSDNHDWISFYFINSKIYIDVYDYGYYLCAGVNVRCQ